MVTNKNELNELYWNCDTDTVNSHEYSMKGFRKVNSHWVGNVSNPISLWPKYSSLVAHVDFPSTLLPKWQKHLPHKLHSQPHLPMETTCYSEAWRGFRKQNFGLCSTTCYSTVPINVHKHGFIVHNCFITINCWSAAHYDISLQWTSLQQYIVVIHHFVLRDIVATKSR